MNFITQTACLWFTESRTTGVSVHIPDDSFMLMEMCPARLLHVNHTLCYTGKDFMEIWLESLISLGDAAELCIVPFGANMKREGSRCIFSSGAISFSQVV